MTRLDAVIKDIKDVNLMGNAWIYDDDGNIKDNVICGNVLPWLEELKDYEIDVDDEFINYILENSDIIRTLTSTMKLMVLKWTLMVIII